MIEAINLEEAVEYICQEDRESENPTKWKFKRLTLKEEQFIKNLSRKIVDDESGEILIKCHEDPLHIALLEPENFNGKFERNNKTGHIVDKIKPWSDSTLSQIPFNIRDELVSFVIRGYSELEKEELKN